VPVSGLVLTLSRDPDDAAAALCALRGHPAIEVGRAQGQRLPIVADTRAEEEDKAVWEWLHTLEGVLFVDLVSADSSDDPPGGNRT
jgi:nitrate reductase NapAB chaperone NapD